jgi:hypothetical protein
LSANRRHNRIKISNQIGYCGIKFVKAIMRRTLILPAVLYGCETWSNIKGREEYRLRLFENRVLRRIFGPKRDEVTGEWRKLHNGSFIICTHHQILLGSSNQGE